MTGPKVELTLCEEVSGNRLPEVVPCNKKAGARGDFPDRPKLSAASLTERRIASHPI